MRRARRRRVEPVAAGRRGGASSGRRGRSYEQIELGTLDRNGSRGTCCRRTVGRKPRPDATPEERRLWPAQFVPGAKVPNKGKKRTSEEVAAQRAAAEATLRDKLYAVGKARPARLGEEVRPAGMVAWLRVESAAKQQRAEGKKQQPRKGDRTASERERASILRLRERGLAIRAIATKLGLPYMAVREVVVVEGRGHH
jgi:hypothetical protein